jgi:oligogalacturonide lyase
VRMIEAGRKTARVYYVRGNEVCWTDVASGETHTIGTLPRRGLVVTVNADETLLAGTYIEGDGPDYNNNRPPPTQPSVAAAAAARGAAAVGGAGGVETTAGAAAGAGAGSGAGAGAQASPATQAHPLDQPRNKGQMMEQRWAARLPMGLFTMSVQTGEVKTIHRSRDWLNHLLFSPTDPTLLMFCHEGPWHKVDRIWTIRTDGTQITKVHTRTMAMEIFGHEFWSADGKTIWYDLQTPRGEDFWLAGYRVDTEERTWYHLQRDEWSIHFNVSGDGTLMCGDGGDPGQVAHAQNGEWIYLFRPERFENRGLQDPHFVQAGVLHAERLVNMSKHQYRLEPNVSFTPDQQWVVFRSNMFGPTYVFAVEVAKATPTQ